MWYVIYGLLFSLKGWKILLGLKKAENQDHKKKRNKNLRFQKIAKMSLEDTK